MSDGSHESVQHCCSADTNLMLHAQSYSHFITMPHHAIHNYTTCTYGVPVMCPTGCWETLACPDSLPNCSCTYVQANMSSTRELSQCLHTRHGSAS